MGGELLLRRALDVVQHLSDPTPPWADIIKASAELMGCYGGCFLVLEGSNIVEFQEFGADQTAIDDYAAHYHKEDILLRADLVRAPGTWLDTQSVMSSTERENNAYYVDFMCPQRMRQIFSLLVDEDEVYTTAISFQRETADAKSAEFLSSTPVRQFKNAIQAAVAKRREVASQWVASAEEAFESFGEAMCLVDSAGRILHQSPTTIGLLESHGELRIRNGRFWHPADKVRSVLADTFSRCAASGRPVRTIFPSKGEKSCTFEVARAAHQAHLDRRPLFIVRLRKSRAKADIAVDGLVAAMGLTDAEGRVLGALIEGKSPGEIASSHGISINTVRTQIATLLQKTGCARQIDLVRMVLLAH